VNLVNRRVAPSALLVAAAAGAGAVLGHALTYLLVVPSAGARDALLASTGHSYWSAAVLAAALLGLLSAGAVAVRNFRGGLRGEETIGPDGIGRLAIRLGVMQSVIFLLQEVLERLEAHAPITTLMTGRVLLVGVLIQTLVGLALAFVLFFIARAAAAAGYALRRPAPARPSPLPRPVRVAAVRQTAVAAAGGIRAPPR
jgi:hypothetical protein